LDQAPDHYIHADRYILVISSVNPFQYCSPRSNEPAQSTDIVSAAFQPEDTDEQFNRQVTGRETETSKPSLPELSAMAQNRLSIIS
jgi:hypothetical protein